MFEKDWNIVNESLSTIKQRTSFNDMNNINPYENKYKAQSKCKHMWDNDTDATYYAGKGKRKCAICGKTF